MACDAIHWLSSKIYCSAGEFRHPNEVRHSYFMTVLKLLYYDLPTNNGIQTIIPCSPRQVYNWSDCRIPLTEV